MTIDTRQLPAVDSHVHIFADERDGVAADPLRPITLGGDDPGFLGVAPDSETAARLLDDQRHMPAYQRAVHRLARLLDVEPHHEAVIEARTAEAKRDFAAWVAHLYRDAGIASAIVDTGHPRDTDLDAFGSLVPADVTGIYRVEIAMLEEWPAASSLQDFKQRLTERLESVHRDERFVSWKTVIAYRTGLEIDLVSEADAARAFETLQRTDDPDLFARVDVDEELFPAMKAVRDHMLCHTLGLCVEFGVPIQVHTGWGDQDVTFDLARPSLMRRVLRHETYRHAVIVLLHASYPYYGEAAFLANAFPNVYLDTSLVYPFLPTEGREVYRTVLSLTPSTKVLYSSDAYGSVEMQWLATADAKEAIGAVLGEFVTEEVYTAEAAERAARQILQTNAQGVYGLR